MVRFKMLAPNVVDDGVSEYLREIKRLTGIEFQLTVWDGEYLELYHKHEAKYADLRSTERMFAPVKAKLIRDILI